MLKKGFFSYLFKVEYEGKTCAMRIYKRPEGGVNREWLLLKLNRNYFGIQSNFVFWIRALPHPNIIKAIALIDSDALLLEFAEAGDLQSFLEKQERPIGFSIFLTHFASFLSFPSSDHSLQLKFAKEICEGMIFVHEQGILHLDLRCSNIMLTKDLQIKISGECYILKIFSTKMIFQIFRLQNGKTKLTFLKNMRQFTMLASKSMVRILRNVFMILDLRSGSNSIFLHPVTITSNRSQNVWHSVIPIDSFSQRTPTFR